MSNNPAPAAPPLTAARMVDRCWTHPQAAVAAGRLIEARGWLRLYRDLKPFVPHEEIAAREAGMDRAAAERREAEAAAAESAPPEAPSDDQDIALPLHCFSAPESHEPFVIDEDAPRAAAAAKTATPVSTRDLARLATRLAAVARQVEQAARDETVRPPLHCFSPPESHEGPVDDLSRAMRDLQTEILSLGDSKPLSDARPGAP
jgi:hypothetical protein